MDKVDDISRRSKGAFRPVIGSYGYDYPNNNGPPEQFVASRMSGGLKHLFSQLSITKKEKQNQETTKINDNVYHSPSVPNLAARYKVLQLIGQGRSSVLVAAEDLYHPTKQVVAIKIMNLDYKSLGAQEADCIQKLNRADPLKLTKVVRLLNKFTFDRHFCMAFEILRPRPLHHYFQRADFDSQKELLESIREVTIQVLGVLGFLKRQNIIHADLKPENILLESGKKMNIKVVDFGNAIRWIHQEISLYYDNFELQTLLYRAPEVMFGAPFGPEIDMWSLGCIVAELYLGEPLFMGHTKMDVLQKVVSLLGPFPRIPFQSGKFYPAFSCFINSKTGAPVPFLELRIMKKLHNIKNFTFANFLSGILRYNPNNRFTPVQAASHPFLALHVPFAANTGDEVLDVSQTHRSGVLLTPSQYFYRPNIDEDIRRQQLSSIDLLRCGTRGKDSLVPKRTSTPPVGRVVPLVKEEMRPVGRHGICGLSPESDADMTAPEKKVEQRTHCGVLSGELNNAQQQKQKSLSLDREMTQFPISSEILDNTKTFFEKPAKQPRWSEETFGLTIRIENMPCSNEPIADQDTPRAQVSSAERIVHKNFMMRTSNQLKPDQVKDTSKEKSCEWLEDAVNRESLNLISKSLETTSSARTRIYYSSRRSKSQSDADHAANVLSLSAEERSSVSEGSKVDASRMSCTIGDTNQDIAPFLIDTKETKTRSMLSFKKAYLKNSTIYPQRINIPEKDIVSTSKKIIHENKDLEIRTRRDCSSKKNVKLYKLEKEEKAEKLTQHEEGDTPVTPKRVRRSLKLIFSHEDDEVNLL